MLPDMANSKNRRFPSIASCTGGPPKTTSALKSDPILGYKLRILLYDLRNISKDKASEQRTLATVDELYISSPYFTSKEAAWIKTATVNHNMFSIEQGGDSQGVPSIEGPLTVENAIHTKLAQFLEKRRAGGDARPCGPHDMAPVYEAVFGIPRQELEDEKFLGRLRRQGIPALEVAKGQIDKSW